MKKVIVSFAINIFIAIFLVSLISYLIYQGIDMEIHKNINSAPSYVCFIPACLLGIILAPYLVTLINHIKSLKLIKLNNNNIDRKLLTPILVGYILVCASVIIDIVYLLFDGIFTQKIIIFSDPLFSLAVFSLIAFYILPPIILIIVLVHKKKA